MVTIGQRPQEVLFEDLNETQQRLLRAAKRAFKRAYNPYSRFAVGAALLTKAGKMITASNIENAAYPSGICAEGCGIGRANAEGHGFDCIAIAVVALNDENPTKQITAPCGECRQRIFEAACRSQVFEQFEIILATTDFSQVMVVTIGDLLPLAFGPRDLEQPR